MWLGQEVQAMPRQEALTRRRTWLSALIVVWGAQAIVTQSLFLRAALVLMSGSELVWGIVLFAWLLGIAGGAVAGAKLAESDQGRRRPELWLITVLMTLSAAACLQLWVFSGAREWLGVGPGVLLPLPQTALSAVLLVSPASALVGMAFPLACRVTREDAPESNASTQTPAGASRPALTFGGVYALESLGSLAGGAAFSFWAVEHLSPIQTALLCSGITACAAAGLLAVTGAAQRQRAMSAAALAIVGLGTVLSATFIGDALNQCLIERRWKSIAPGCKLVAEVESKYQNLTLGSREKQFTLFCDGQVAADFPDPYSYAPPAHFWLCQHPDPRRVLVLGGGAEGLLAEMLRHPIEHIDYVEPDSRQIELIEPYLAAVDREALQDARVSVHHVDARYFIKSTTASFDLVIMCLPEPLSALWARFHTDEFYQELRHAMADRAVLCMTAAAAPGELSPLTREYLATIRATLKRHFLHVIVSWGDPANVLAATDSGLLSTKPEELARRYTQRGVKSPYFQSAWFDGAVDWLDPDKLARRAADLDAAGDVPISTDLQPRICVQRLALWERASGGGGVIQWLRAVGLSQVAYALLLVGVSIVITGRLRTGTRVGWARGAVTLSVVTTGFVTMALSIVWLFAFQNLYGYVYQRIGWIIALFMAGLVAGCLGAERIVHSNTDGKTTSRPTPARRHLMVVDLSLAALALLAPLIVSSLARLQSGPRALLAVESCVSSVVVLTGLLGGATFSLAGCLRLTADGRPGAAAGSVVGADHFGACLGALLCGVLLVPVYGMMTTAMLLAGMKLASAGVLGGVGRLGGYDQRTTAGAAPRGRD